MKRAECRNPRLTGRALMLAAAGRLAGRAVAARVRRPRRNASGINPPRQRPLEDQGWSACHGETFRMSFDPYEHGPVLVDGSAAGVPDRWEFIG